jgi:hypothetical protein
MGSERSRGPFGPIKRYRVARGSPDVAPRKASSPFARFPGPEFHVATTFRAPLEYVYRWCTDYTPHDPVLEGEKFLRKVLEKTRRRAIFEDLEETPTGWDWARSVVTLHPPDGWILEQIGNRSDAAAVYRLTRLPDGRVQLDLAWRRRSHVPSEERLSKRARELRSSHAWERFARALERDHRRGSARHRR